MVTQRETIDCKCIEVPWSALVLPLNLFTFVRFYYYIFPFHFFKYIQTKSKSAEMCLPVFPTGQFFVRYIGALWRVINRPVLAVQYVCIKFMELMLWQNKQIGSNINHSRSGYKISMNLMNATHLLS